jgi:hypothetical protein
MFYVMEIQQLPQLQQQQVARRLIPIYGRQQAKQLPLRPDWGQGHIWYK